MRELLGVIAGYVLVVVVAWFISWSIVAYVVVDWNPVNWGVVNRQIHLLIQVILIAMFAFYRYRQGRRA